MLGLGKTDKSDASTSWKSHELGDLFIDSSQAPQLSATFVLGQLRVMTLLKFNGAFLTSSVRVDDLVQKRGCWSP